MKRFFTLFLCLYLSMDIATMKSLAAPQWPNHVSIQAGGDIVMDAGTGAILYGKNMDQQYYPAGITKILATLIVPEHCDLDEIVSFSHDDVYNVETGSSSTGIDRDDVLTVRDCLYALLLASTNESTNALACHISNSQETFARLMNGKTTSLGCTGSNFINPSGLNDEDHYTAVHGMALIAKEAIKNPEFLAIDITRSYRLAPTRCSPEGGYVANHHEMFDESEPVYYLGTFAEKTGHTSLAGNTPVACAKEDGMTLIAVVLNGHQSHYAGTKALFDFSFHNSQSLKAVDCEIWYKSLRNDMTITDMTVWNSISLKLDRNGCMVMPKDADFTDTGSTLTYDLDSSSPRNGVAYTRYTYNRHRVGFVYPCSSSMESFANPMTAATTPPQAAADDGNQPVPGQNPGRNSSQNPGQDSGQNLGHKPGQGDLQDQGSGLSTDGSLTPSATWPDITTKESTASSIRIPANALTILGITLSLCVIVAIVAAVKIHVKKKEEAGLTLRRQHRLERLEDIGCSSTDLDKLAAERRVPSPSKRKNRRGRHRRTFFR